MTNHFQTLDLTVNRNDKAHMRNSTQNWVTIEVQRQLENRMQPENVKINTRLSVIKPIHAKSITSFYDYIHNNMQIVLNGWENQELRNF